MHGYRIYEIWRDGKNGARDYREYWLAYYFEGTCRHIYHVGRKDNVIREHKITESLNLLESVPYGTATWFTLDDEISGKQIQIPTLPDYMEFREAVDENHYIFYDTGRNTETEGQHTPCLVHFVRTDRDSAEFEVYTE